MCYTAPMGHRLSSPLLRASGFRHAFWERPQPTSAANQAASGVGGRVAHRTAPDAAGPGAASPDGNGYVPGGDPLEHPVCAKQVHGTRVIAVPTELPPEGESAETEGPAVEGDALAAGAGNIAVGIYTADCLPLLLADPRTGSVAAVHAGWRGLVSGIVPATLAHLAKMHGSRMAELQAAIFPHIGPCCFEIGADVAGPLAEVHPQAVIRRPGRERPFGDLGLAVRAQLLAAGLVQHAIDRVAGCTACDPASFFSFRRDGRGAGRHLTAIASAPG